MMLSHNFVLFQKYSAIPKHDCDQADRVSVYHERLHSPDPRSLFARQHAPALQRMEAVRWCSSGCPADKLNDSPRAHSNAAARLTEAPQAAGETAMVLLTYYTILAIVGVALSAIAGIAIERTIPGLDLPVFFTLFTLVLWVAWKLAVYLTEPKLKKAEDARVPT